MLPIIQMIPNQMFPFNCFYNTSGVQYFSSQSLINSCYSQPIVLPYYSFNNKLNGLTSLLPLTLLNGEQFLSYQGHKQLNFSTSNKNNSQRVKSNKEKDNDQYGTLDEQVNGDQERKIRIQNSKIKIDKISQNRNRNIIPSVVQQIFSYLSKPNKSKSTVILIFSHYEQSQTFVPTIQKYFYLVKHIKQKQNHYLNANSLSVLCQIQEDCLQLISKQQQEFYLKIARSVSKFFVDNLLPLLIIHSKRMFSQKRIQHMKIRRILLQVLENITS